MGKFRSYLRRGTHKEASNLLWNEAPVFAEYICEAGGGAIEWYWNHPDPYQWLVDMEINEGEWVTMWQYEGRDRNGTLWNTVCPAEESHRLRLYGIDEDRKRITQYRTVGPFNFKAF
jgi:hypothetical protein